MTKAKYKAGRQICSIADFSKTYAVWFKWHGKTTHRSVLMSLQYRTLLNTIINGWLFEAELTEGE
jgi:hypothetical protein